MGSPIEPEKRMQWLNNISIANKGKTLSYDHKVKISNSLKGHVVSDNTKEKQRQSHIGKPVLEESRIKIQLKMMGKNHPFFGKKLSETHKENMRKAKLGKHLSEETKKKLSNIFKGHEMSVDTRNKIRIANLGKKKSPETLAKMSRIRKGKRCGEQNPAWKGGISYEPYCIKFNNEFKERVRAFFGYQCVECGSLENGTKLHVHHVNFKKNSCCDPEVERLFVPLCQPCHSRTNSKRDYWKQHFTDIINRYYEGKCYLTKEEMEKYNGY